MKKFIEWLGFCDHKYIEYTKWDGTFYREIYEKRERLREKIGSLISSARSQAVEEYKEGLVKEIEPLGVDEVVGRDISGHQIIKRHPHMVLKSEIVTIIKESK